MTIYTIDPTIAAEMQWGFLTNTQTFTAPMAASEQTAELPGARWTATLSHKNLTASVQRTLASLLVKLRGSAGRAYVPISAVFPRQGAGGGTPLVKGGSQRGRSLLIDGATPNVTGWLKDGDYFHFDSGGLRELKLVTADVNTDSSGNATISFEPPIRTSPADNAAVEISAPSALMRLVDDRQVNFTIRPAILSDAAVQFIESFPT